MEGEVGSFKMLSHINNVYMPSKQPIENREQV